MSKPLLRRCGLAFLLGGTGLLFLFFIFLITPFGDRYFLTSDLYHQYYVFHTWFGDILRTGQWDKFLYEPFSGLGNPMIGTFAYYLSSPFSLLAVFFNKETMPLGITLILTLKMGAITASFYWFLNRYFKESRTWHYLWALFYAFSSFSITYLMNFMWLDQLIVLPLLCYSGLLWLRENKKRPLLLCLLLSFWVNFYTSYMSGVFLAFFLSAEFFSTHELTEWKIWLKRMFQLAGFALLTFASLGFLLVPTLFQMFSAGNSILMFNAEIIYPLFDVVQTLCIGFYDGVQTEDLPPLFFGMLPLLFTFSFFFNSAFSTKERRLHLYLFMFLSISFMVNPLYNFWHGFKSPAWFSGRHAFVFAFYGLFLGARSLHAQRYSSVHTKNSFSFGIYVLFTLYLLTTALVTANIVPATYEHLSFSPFILSWIFLGLYFLFSNPQHSAGWRILFYLGFLELFLSTGFIFNAFVDDLTLENKEGFESVIANTESELEYIQTLDNNNEASPSRYQLSDGLLNSSLLYKYPGIHNFNTLAQLQSNAVLNYLTGHNQLSMATLLANHTHPFINSLLGLSYLATPNEIVEFYEPTENSSIFYNPYALPLGFMSNKEILDFKFFYPSSEEVNVTSEEKETTPNRSFPANYLAGLSQNQLLNSLLGQTDHPIDYIKAVPYTLMSSTNLEFNSKTEIYSSINPEKEANLTLHFYPEKEKRSYVTLYIPLQNPEEILISLNGKPLELYGTDVLIVDEEFIELSYTCIENAQCAVVTPMIYQLELSLLQEALLSLKEHSLQITKQNTTSLSGTLTANEDGILFTRIPYNPGWEITIDGEPVEGKGLVHGSFLGVEVPKGTHEITFTFTPPGFKEGILLSLMAMNIYFFYWIFITIKPYIHYPLFHKKE